MIYDLCRKHSVLGKCGLGTKLNQLTPVSAPWLNLLRTEKEPHCPNGVHPRNSLRLRPDLAPGHGVQGVATGIEGTGVLKPRVGRKGCSRKSHTLCNGQCSGNRRLLQIALITKQWHSDSVCIHNIRRVN